VSSGYLRSRLLTGIGSGLLMAGLAGAATPAFADTLREALSKAYASNPILHAARARQRALDETVPIERAAGLPSITSDATFTEFVQKSPNSFTSPDRALTAQVQLGVPVYSGGAVRNAVKAARTRVEAGQADLRGTESAIFSQVVAAYMDVILQEAIVGLRSNQVEVLGVNLQATSDRFEIGDLTRTDAAQSQARLALAQGDARIAAANLATARENYIRLVGSAPGRLEPPPPLPNFPATAGEAVAIALEYNPDLIAAREQAAASRYDIDVAGASRLPKVSLYSQGGYNDYFGTLGGGIPGADFAQSEKSAQVGARVTLPLFQGGRPAALRRRAQAFASAALESEIAAEREVIAQTRAAWSTWVAARDLIESSQLAVDAAELSLEGVRAENTVGNRTILDILDAEQELLTTRVRLVTARRNAYVAGFTLLAAMGRAEARDLGLDGGALYDPQDNYERVRGKWLDWESDPLPQAQALRTVDTAVQDGEVPEN
jgi:outer membrane protein